MERIFFSAKNKEYCTDDNIPCSFCDRINSFFFLVTFSRPNFYQEYFYCDKCVKDIPEQPHLIKTMKMILKVDILPKDAVPMIDNRVDTGFGKMGLSVWDVANKQIDNEHITDKTIYAGRESFEGATIGFISNEKERLIDAKNIKKLLE